MKKHLKIISALAAFAMIPFSAFSAASYTADTVDSGAMRNAEIIAGDYEEVGSTLVPTGALPSSYSSAEAGYVTGVRSQLYNTCWAYSSTAALETLMLKNGTDSGWLSPMHMNFWATVNDDGTGWNRTYTGGGYPYIALGYLTSWTGARLETEFPYTTLFENYQTLDEQSSTYAGINSAVYIDGSDIDTVKTAVTEYGAVVGNFHYFYQFLSSSNSAYCCDEEGLSTGQLVGHSVSIIGWDDAYEKENFAENHQPENDGAWLCKNSYGETWGSQGGYIWISYEDKYLFDARFGPSYALTSFERVDDTKKIYQNEIYGATYGFEYLDSLRSDKMTYVNVFDFDSEYATIDKINFESTAEGATYRIYYIPVDEDGVPNDNTDNWIFIRSGKINYQGYISVDIDDFTVAHDKGAIGIQIERSSKEQSLAIGCDEWIKNSNGFLFMPDAQRGSSYIIGYDTEPMDLMDFYEEKLDDEIGASFVIKAVARETADLLGDVDLDGIVSIIDVTCIQRYLALLMDLSARQIALGDYNRDGTFDIVDATSIQRHLAGLDGK